MARIHPGATLELPESLGNSSNPTHRDLGLVFDSNEAWLRHWQKFRNLRHEFVNLDPLRQPAAMADYVQSHAEPFTIAAIDDCFDAFDGLMLFDWARRKSAYDALVQGLKSNSQVYVVVGTPPRRRIRG